MYGRNEPVLLREDQGGVVLLTLNRPQARNALSRTDGGA
jgi:enoyl-CoA hydratase/carnithine racemase